MPTMEVGQTIVEGSKRIENQPAFSIRVDLKAYTR
jgi:hypothetical protein